jgi:AcrR family transcriptional regulator
MANPIRNTTRQREAGAASRLRTRQLLLDAAAAEFVDVGYVAATVAHIAARAGVTVQTLYLAWGSKRELLRAYVESTLAPGSTPSGDYFLARLDAVSETDIVPRIAEVFCEVARRSAVGWALYRDGSAVDPRIAEDWHELQTLRRETFVAIVGRIPEESLRLPRDAAIDTAWAIASPAVYDLMVNDRGYDPDRFEAWLAATLGAALLH